MICPKCSFEQVDGLPACPRCGVIFAKLKGARDRAVSGETGTAAPAGPATTVGLLSRLREQATAMPAEPVVVTMGRGILLALMLVWGWRLTTASIASGYAADSPLHLVHLPFHEAGHVIFGLLGIRFITVLGGTLGQLLVPIIVICAFVGRRDPFGGSVGLWWLGHSFMDVAIYANDARAGELMLLGGVTGKEVEDYHDWEVMLGKMGWLAYDHQIARLLYAAGAILIVVAVAWGGLLLWQQLRQKRGRP